MTGQLANLLPLLLFFAMMYFFLLRPQQREQKKRQEMLNSIKEGDKVVTTGGIHAVITKVMDTSFLARIAQGVEVEVQKSGVAYVVRE
ncbi:MAG: preprotein translocase subunit YajC [Ignavibacteriales bacterium]